MSTTVYTYNDKVLVNSANDKWLKKPEVVDYVTIGTQTWKIANLAEPIGILNSAYIIRDGKYYYSVKASLVRDYITSNYPGWHIPTTTDFNTLKTTVNNDAATLAAAGFSIDEAVGGYWHDIDDHQWHYLSNNYQYLMSDIYSEYGDTYYRYFKADSNTMANTSWGGEEWEGYLADNIALPIRLIQDSN